MKTSQKREKSSGKTYILVSGAWGTKIPRIFAENFDTCQWHVAPENANILLEGEENALYDDVWEDVFQTAYYMKGNKKYHLAYNDTFGDLVAIPD